MEILETTIPGTLNAISTEVQTARKFSSAVKISAALAENLRPDVIE